MQILNKILTPITGENVAIRTVNLSKQFKKAKVAAVSNVNLEVQQGDVFGLLGPNGAGKTTIIRMLLGLIAPTAGKTAVFGFDSMRQRADVLARVAAIVEAPALYPSLSGLNNLRVMAIAMGLDQAEADKRIPAVLDKMGLSNRANDKYKSYSLGMKQRLCIAAALLNNPQLIILDEPTNGLDPAGMAEMRQLIRELAEQGRTVVLSSHLLNEVQMVCNRVAIIQQGQIIAQGLVDELLANKTSLRIRVRQDEWEKAWNILVSNGWANKLTSDSGYFVVDAAATHGANLNQVLAAHGIFASEITPHAQSLEDYFLSLTA